MKFIPSPHSAALGSAISIAQSHALDYTKSALTSSQQSGATKSDPHKDFYESAWKVQNLASAFNTLAEAGLVPDDAYIAANGNPYVYDWLKEDGTIDMSMFTIKEDGSNIEDFSTYLDGLNNLSADADFNAWGSQTTDRESAYKLGVDKGRND